MSLVVVWFHLYPGQLSFFFSPRFLVCTQDFPLVHHARSSRNETRTTLQTVVHFLEECLVKSLFGLGVLSLFMTGSYGKLKATFPMLSKSLFINYFETYSKTQLSSTCVSSSFDKIVILKFIWESDSVTH